MRPWKTGRASYTVRVKLLLQWGHGDEAVEDNRIIRIRQFNALLQWGHGDEAVEDPEVQGSKGALEGGFNGATAMRPWKTMVRGGEEAGPFFASMGPRR